MMVRTNIDLDFRICNTDNKAQFHNFLVDINLVVGACLTETSSRNLVKGTRQNLLSQT